ncbi:hypothetical protein I4F81_005921 [Pyropia yezoensis]|uniref:Uncharacterized protein n=1 Tax=Pyropia yezoensis TaxID=2788 RepID=A0ACC3C089_PYRYE|nr:hypothetical protein I4F81_005921 [Neopyropia yezoensis]
MLFRMEREDFHALLELLRDNISANEDMASLSAGEPIPAECRLAMYLHILAGASYLDCALAFGVGRSTVFGIFDQCESSARVLLMRLTPYHATIAKGSSP